MSIRFTWENQAEVSAMLRRRRERDERVNRLEAKYKAEGRGERFQHLLNLCKVIYRIQL